MSYSLRGNDVPPTGGMERYADPGYVPPTGGMYDYAHPAWVSPPAGGYRTDESDATATDEQNAPGCDAQLENDRGYGDGYAGQARDVSCNQFSYDCGFSRAQGVTKPGCGGGTRPPSQPGTPNTPQDPPADPSSSDAVAHGSILDKALPWIIGGAVVAAGLLLAIPAKAGR